MLKPLYVSFYTQGTGYEREAQGLRESLDNFGLEHHIEPAPDLGGWQANTQYKAVFILAKMRSFPQRTVVWIDADARVRRYPELIDRIAENLSIDVAAHLYRGALNSAVVVFNPTPSAMSVLNLWKDENERNPQTFDQQTLHNVIKSLAPGIGFYELPPGYCYIFDLSRRAYPRETVYIEQLQASRRLKGRLRCLMAANQRAAIIASIPPAGRMLEWGVGGTTLRIIAALREEQALTSVEHHRGWAGRVSDEVAPLPEAYWERWTLLIKEPSLPDGVGRNATHWEESPAALDSYIHPCDLSGFDVFLVDGVARGSCLCNIFDRGRSGARVFLHDAQRPWYDWARRHSRITEERLTEHDPGDYAGLLWSCVLR